MIALAVIALYLLTGAYHVHKPLPPGLDIAGPYRPVDEIEFLMDTTWLDDRGRQHTEHEILDAALDMIRNARSMVVADFFLLNQFAGNNDGQHRALSNELVEAFLQRREDRPRLNALLITDPFNSLYGGMRQTLFTRLETGGVHVVETHLAVLRDPNPAWSAAWRICCQWFGNNPDGGWLPNPLGEAPVTLRTYLALLNFKANHRKTLVTDGPDGWTGLVTSGNPHDASSRHHNVAIRFRGQAALDLLQTELAVAAFSDGPPILLPDPGPQDAKADNTILGHFRHESGHYYWDRMVRGSEWLQDFRHLFGDETLDYGQALERHHANGPPAGWQEHFVSAYASSHPWEDWAETWAHYLHIVDTLETARSFGVGVRPETGGSEPMAKDCGFNPYAQSDFAPILEHWLPLAFALNSLNRSIGHEDAYPFVLAPPAVEKLRLVHRIIHLPQGA